MMKLKHMKITTSLINLENLYYQYDNTKNYVLDGISLSVDEGEIFGLLGPSGAGKSTAQRVLIGLLKNYEGKAEILGKEVKDWNQNLYEQIGVSFEIPTHYLKLTGLENLEYFSSLYHNQHSDLLEVMDSVGLADAANQRVSGYSKGMKNRLSVARSIIHKPKILFLDEPTAGLDPISVFKIQTLINKLKKLKTTVFLNTHNMDIAAKLCDRVAFIHNGKIAEMGTPENLKQKYGQSIVKIDFIMNSQNHSKVFPLEKLGLNSDFLELISQYEIKTIHSSEASLDDIFRKVTGQTMHSSITPDVSL